VLVCVRGVRVCSGPEIRSRFFCFRRSLTQNSPTTSPLAVRAVFDLLAEPVPGAKAGERVDLPIVEKGGVPTVQGAQSVDIESQTQLEALLQQATTMRATSSTKMNSESSRSHSVFALHLVGKHATEAPRGVTGSLHLVDLAGSERAAKSGVVGQGKKEATAINQSLTSLTGVFRSIQMKSSHIAFRNSKLTRLLQRCFKDGGKTLVIVNVAPTLQSREETLCALKFAKNVSQCELGVAKRSTIEAAKPVKSKRKSVASSENRLQQPRAQTAAPGATRQRRRNPR